MDEINHKQSQSKAADQRLETLLEQVHGRCDDSFPD